MYKSKEQQKEANRVANQEYRKRKGITQGITGKGITGEGITFLGNPIKCPESMTLSDGQVWHPGPKYWGSRVEKDIEYLEVKYPNKECRRENALKYKEWASKKGIFIK